MALAFGICVNATMNGGDVKIVREVDTYEYQLANWHVERRQWYIDTEKSEDGFSVSAPYYDAQTGLYCVTLAQIVYGGNGEFPR